MAGGRPRHYDNAEDLEKEIDAYFEHIKGEQSQDKLTWIRIPEPATITGLALHLGFESRQSVYDYAKDGTFSYLIKKAQMKVECEYEKKLTTAQSPTGSIFALKNMGWKDRSEVDQTFNGNLNVNSPTVQLPDGTNLEI